MPTWAAYVGRFTATMWAPKRGYESYEPEDRQKADAASAFRQNYTRVSAMMAAEKCLDGETRETF